MPTNILLCRDGVMRFKHWFFDSEKREGTMYHFSYEAYEKLVGNAFLKHIGYGFEMEENLTVKELFQNLQPFSDEIEGLAAMDFDGFYQEAMKPPEDLSSRDRFSHIDVRGFYTLDAVPAFERREPEDNVEPDVDGKLYSMEAFNRSLGIGPPKITDQLEVIEMWTNSAVLRTPDYDENTDSYIHEYSIDYTPVSQWAHLPVKVNPLMELLDTSRNSDYLTTNEPLINPNHPLVKDDGHSLSVKIDDGGPSFYKAIIEGCLRQWGFHYSPVVRDEQIAEITRRIDEIDGEASEQEDNLDDLQAQEDKDEKEGLEALLELDDYGYKK